MEKHRCSYRTVPIEKCFVDDDYQRELNETRAKSMATKHDELLEGTIEVSERSDGRFAVIVGQHRVEMLRLKGRKRMWAKVWTGLTKEQEAFIYDTQPRTEKRISAFDTFHSRLFRKEEAAVEMARVANSYGFEFAQTQGPNYIQAVSACEVVYRRSPVLYEEMFAVLRTWTSPKGPQTAIIRGLANALEDLMASPKYSRSALIDALRIYPHDDVLRLAAYEAPASVSLSSWSGSPFIGKEITKIFWKAQRGWGKKAAA